VNIIYKMPTGKTRAKKHIKASLSKGTSTLSRLKESAKGGVMCMRCKKKTKSKNLKLIKMKNGKYRGGMICMTPACNAKKSLLFRN